jgi:hypothetical protein
VGIVEKWLVGRLSDQKGGISHMKFITVAQTRDECSFEKGGIHPFTKSKGGVSYAVVLINSPILPVVE